MLCDICGRGWNDGFPAFCPKMLLDRSVAVSCAASSARATRISTTRAVRTAARATAASVVARGCGAGHSLQRGIEGEAGGGKVASGSGSQTNTLDVLGDTEVLFTLGTTLYFQTDRENGKVGELDVLAEQEQLLGATDGIGEHSFDGTLRERGVVACHVGCQLFQSDGLLDDRAWIPLAVCQLVRLVFVLIQLNSNHNVFVVKKLMKSLTFNDNAKIQHRGGANEDKRALAR